MKLDRIEIKNYRSLFHDYDSNESFRLDLGEGMNAITGPNNAGKSNVFRALALALDPDCAFDRSADMPSLWNYSKPSVTLTFQIPTQGRSSKEKTLLKYLEQYERKVNPTAKRTYAEDGVVKLRVTIEGASGSSGTRREVFVARGGGALSLGDEDDLARRAIEQFHKCLHFVMISSGQSLESLMEGKFRDILHNVLLEDLRAEFRAANESRGKYEDELRGGLLKPLADRISSEVHDLFPEISGVTLDPSVLPLEETLAHMAVRVSDRAVTDLADKGTGVRGGLIIAMLRHFADVGKRSMLFAVEEPESFLHPAAQEQLREDLEALADRRDVSLLVTTHSPYIVSRLPDSKVFALDKDGEGRTVISAEATGADPHAPVMGGLFRDRLSIEWIDRAQSVPAGTGLILVVEGPTDQAFAELALTAAGRPDLLAKVHFLHAGAGLASGGGAHLAVMQALLARSTSPSTVKVAALFDDDDPGREAANMLSQIGKKTDEWKKGKSIFSYAAVFHASKESIRYEAEDLWPNSLHDGFLAICEDQGWLKRKEKLNPPEVGYQYDWTSAAKWPLVTCLRDHVESSDCQRWVELFELIHKGAGIQPEVVPGAGMPDVVPTAKVSPVGESPRSYLTAVLAEARSPLEAAGLERVRMHTGGAFIEMRPPKEAGLEPADGHFLIKVTAADTKVDLVLHKLPDRRSNFAALEVLRSRYEDEIASNEDGLYVTSWTAGQGDAVRSYAQTVRRGSGRSSATPADTAKWAVDVCLAWTEVLLADPIPDLLGAVDQQLAATTPAPDDGPAGPTPAVT